ncbi:toprim domain-containing protein [Bradyrhizobium sp. 160]|uniref:toprim domain-containing protein n=1 Tax=unclassified Bradyrhizobium TaxID=2631580 RepID=UPI001FFC1135|nr:MULTISPECIES: toprim domain-containing protein [unclassified Bradyrhizobium]MCK1542202.1 toprim domain-containing protein [Bradyrhizobium sp. 179]MCK1627830.1 toprim domain-containing protein [Bradyrhizobium sp. 160]
MEPEFATFRCARCEAGGYSVGRNSERADPEILEKARAKSRELQLEEAIKSRRKAQWLWSQREPIIGSIAETYLRRCRGYQGDLHATLGFLPSRGDHPPAMIAAFGAAVETLPGELAIYDLAIRGVHVTKLKADGTGKAGTEADKLTIGVGNTLPIWLAPVNDGGGLAICEGIEDALSVHAATGLGAWAAGTAGRLPAMAEHVPAYVEAVTIFVDADPVGEKNSIELAARLEAKGFEARLVRPGAHG